MEGCNDPTPTPASHQDGKDPDPLLAAQTAVDKANEAPKKAYRLDDMMENQAVSADDAQKQEAA